MLGSQPILFRSFNLYRHQATRGQLMKIRPRTVIFFFYMEITYKNLFLCVSSQHDTITNNPSTDAIWSELKSCAKFEVALLGCPSLTVRTSSKFVSVSITVGVKQH